jgi:hypothetical protein
MSPVVLKIQGPLKDIRHVVYFIPVASMAPYNSSRVLRCSSDGSTVGRSVIVITKATQLACFVLSIDHGNGCLNTAQHREKDGQEPHGAVLTLPTLPPSLPVTFRPVIAEVSLQKL